MTGIAEWYTTAGALADTNNDGYADEIAARFIATGVPTAWEWCALADLAAALGLHVTGFSPPLVVAQWAGPSLVLDPADDAALPPGTGRVTLDGGTLTARGGDAEGRAAILRALAQGAPPDAADWQVIAAHFPAPTPQAIPSDPGPPPALDDLFMAQGDSDRAPGLLLDTDDDRIADDTRCCLVVPENISREIGAALVDCAARVGIETAGLTLPLCAPIDLGAAVPVFIGDATPSGTHGEQPRLHALDDGRTAVVIAGETEAATAAMLRDLATKPLIETVFPTFAEPQPAATTLWSWEWQGPTERETLLTHLREHIFPTITDAPCDVCVQISEDAVQRAALREELRSLFPPGSAVTVVPVYHAGRVWLEEIVAPAAKAVPGLAALDVACQPFTPPDDQRYLDMPIRWLQECWPADEIVAPLLGLPPEAVRITLGAADQQETYRARALDTAGASLGEWIFSSHWYARPYLQGFADEGIVHASTGGITIRQGDEVIFDTTLPTDLDRFWASWQGEALPQIRDFAMQAHAAGGTQPFFDELRVEVWVSEPEYALGVREERESPAEGLAEDIYFNTLDAFHALGEQAADAPWDEPGQVVPLVHVAPGEPPRATVTLLRYDAATTEMTPVQVQSRSSGVAMDEVVTGANLPGLLAYADTLPGVTVREVGHSYRGRTVAAIEVVKPDGAAVRSRAKLAAIKPTHLFIARHHANEVASTTAAFRLVDLLATDAAVSPLLDRCNVVVIPDENPDGMALHAMLMAEHPRWKHHAARYNAVGVEFSTHMGDPETPYGEARVRPTLWRQWRPDVITDNHGVPSHEWWQPFAGGTNPPRFHRSYWLCEALIYGICRHAPDEPHATFAAGLRDAVARAIGAEPDLAAANRVYADRYERWGHRYVPEMFPGTEYYRDMLWFFRAADEENLTRRDVALRERAMLSATWVTEVLDETAQGAHLALVAKAHLTANLGLLRMTAGNAPPVAFSATPLAGGGVHHRLHRMRPLPVSADGDS